MKSTTCQYLRGLGSSLLVLLLIAALGNAQAPNPVLTDAQAQILLERLSTQPNLPLTPAESQLLAQYFAAKNGQAIAAAMALQSQSQSQALVQGPMPGRFLMPGAGTRTMGAPPAMPSTAAPVPVTLGPKKAGVIRVGVALPKADLGQGFQGPSAGEPLRSLMLGYLGGPKLEVAPLSALLPQQLDAEAKDKQCDYVVYSTIAMKKTGGLGLLKAASSISSLMPMGMAIGAARAAAGAAAASTTAVGLSSQVKAKSEVDFEYHMFVPGNTTPVLENKSTARAKTDGEDVITPLVESAATSIVAKLSVPN